MDADRWSRVEGLYHQAVLLDRAERASFLARACSDDQDLRAEVESLLDEDAGGDPFLDEPALAVAARLVADEIPVLTGRAFGPYRIGTLLGAGGMGDVYRGRDTVLDRDVAIKILPEAFNDDAERLVRFKQEAQFLASLGHPNIAAIYGVLDADGIRGLVLELVDGETLADRIARGPIPLHDAARIARQVGEGLDAAHQRGVVHRDLKPSNIKIAANGTTKILDFGLATSAAVDASVGGGEPQRVVGTASYMSPEQARGDIVDKRTDIWAFGCVCFEMLTGEPAFRTRRLGAEAHVAGDLQPRWSALPRSVPSRLTALLKRCLDVDLQRRRRDIGDVLTDFDDALRGTSELPAQPRRFGWWLLAGTALLLAVMLPWLFRVMQRPAADPAQPVVYSSVLLPDEMDFPERDNQTAVAPDGSMIAYVAASAGEAPRLLLKRLDAASSQVIGDAVDVRDPFFSPDGRWIGFFSGDTLRKVSVADGRSQVVCHAPRGESGAWDHGFIVFGETGDLTRAGIRRVPENGGESEVISTPQRDAGERSHQAPQLLPDGRTVMYTASGRNSKGAIRRVVVQPPGAPARVLLENASYGRLVGNSVLVYQRGNSLYATRLDLGTLTTSGDGVMLFNDLSPSIRPLWAAGGDVLAYRPRNLNFQFVWVDRQGREASLPSPLRPYRAPSLSPRADRIAVQVAEEDRSDVWMLDVEQQRLTPLTNDGNSEYPMWTPDGGRVGFARRRDDTSDFFVVTPQGTEPRLIKRGDMRMWIGSWMPDMRGIVYMQEDTRTQSDLWLADLQTQAQPRSVVRTAAREYGGRVSPDGRWVAYFSDEHSPNQFELYVAAMPKGAPRHRVAPVGAREAVWARDGSELFYRNGRQMMSARIPRGTDFPEIRPIPLFEGEYLAFGGPGIVNYDVSPDGGRFLMLKPVEDGAHLTVVQGLTRLIRDRLPDRR